MINFIFSIDRKLADYFYYLFSTNDSGCSFVILIAKWLIYLVPVLLVFLWFYKKNYIILLRATFSGLFGWLVIDKIISFFFYRSRPFSESLIGKKEFLFHRPDYSFPSDHAAFLFGISFSFYLCNEKKLFKYFLVISILTSISRVLLGIHYLSDILAGLLVGVIAAVIIKYFDKFIDKYFYQPIIWFYKLIFRFIK